MNNIAELLKVSPEEVKKALCHRVIAVRGEVMEKRHTDSEASFGRDAFAKVIQPAYGSCGSVALLAFIPIIFSKISLLVHSW